jgi:hypothetical protein
MTTTEERKQRAREAASRRAREKDQTKNKGEQMQYYAVIGFFCLSMVGALIYTVFNPTKGFSNMPVIDESAMLIHNGQGHRY